MHRIASLIAHSATQQQARACFGAVGMTMKQQHKKASYETARGGEGT